MYSEEDKKSTMIESTEETLDEPSHVQNFEGESQDTDLVPNFNAEVASVPEIVNNPSIENVDEIQHNEDSDMMINYEENEILPTVPLFNGFQDDFGPVKLENAGDFEPNADGRFTCPTCGKDFRDKSGLKGHMKRHSDIKPHACQICGKSFIKKSDVNR